MTFINQSEAFTLIKKALSEALKPPHDSALRAAHRSVDLALPGRVLKSKSSISARFAPSDPSATQATRDVLCPPRLRRHPHGFARHDRMKKV